MPECPECGTVFANHPGRGRPSVYDTPRCQNRAKQRRAQARNAAHARAFYERVERGIIPEPWWLTRSQATAYLDGHPRDVLDELWETLELPG
jgi:hypothetical protein